MIKLSAKNSVYVLQNMGLIDRVARFVIGGAMLAYAVPPYASWGTPLTLGQQTLMIGISAYALMTAIIGWDPLYALLHVRSGSATGRNQCGTFPYEVKAMLGRDPNYCDSDEIGVEHSLEACHDTPQEQPHHATWKVDQEPMIYPSDAQLNTYFKEQAHKEQVRKDDVMKRAA